MFFLNFTTRIVKKDKINCKHTKKSRIIIFIPFFSECFQNCVPSLLPMRIDNQVLIPRRQFWPQEQRCIVRHARRLMEKEFLDMVYRCFPSHTVSWRTGAATLPRAMKGRCTGAATLLRHRKGRRTGSATLPRAMKG